MEESVLRLNLRFATVLVCSFLVPASALVFLPRIARAQAATPTFNILTRTLMVQSQYGRGTTFSIDVDNREYWITAKHILTGAQHPPYGAITVKSDTLQVLNPGAEGEQWISVNFSVIDTAKDVDIVVLAAPTPVLSDPLPTEPADSTGAMLGGDCEFLGYPFGGSWRASFNNGNSYWMPFMKHCAISGMNADPVRVWILDGINNEGFSGGPVVFRTGTDQRIMAVISGYVTEPAAVISSFQSKPKSDEQKPRKTKSAKKQIVILNSGFIIAYDIKYAIDAIQKTPIGPLRPPPQKK